jgi:preprotein translocase subunit SecG
VVTLVVIVHVIVCLLIIAVVLLQADKGADIGSAFGGTGSQAVFGSMGTPTLLGKITAGIAIAFMLTSFWLAAQGSRRTGTTIMPATTPGASAPAATPPAPTAEPTPAPAGGAPPAAAPAPAGQK